MVETPGLATRIFVTVGNLHYDVRRRTLMSIMGQIKIEHRAEDTPRE